MARQIKRLTVLMLGVSIALAAAARGAPAALERTWENKAQFMRCTWDGRIAVTDEGVRLAKTVFIQDEYGNTHYGNLEPLSDTAWGKKLIQIDDPRCDGAQVIALHGGDRLVCNGQDLGKGEKIPSTGWIEWDVPPEVLKAGTNEFVFMGGGWLLIENSLYPNRSARSADGGRTWDFDGLGPQEVQNGEYLVRLRLAQYPAEGTICSEVVDLADTGTAIRPRVAVQSVGVATDGEVAIELRTGGTPRPDSSWSVWGAEGEWKRYVQWRAILRRGGALETPTLKAVRLNAEVEVQELQQGDKAPRIEVLELTNPEVRRRSYPFAYQQDGAVDIPGMAGEQPGDRLAALREIYKLKEVVAAGETELEKLVLLRDWVRFSAPTGWELGRTRWVPPWDALVLLELNNPPRALCWCTHYTTIFTQCALALGYNAKHVILDHHCVSEVWSDQFGKWILMDTGNAVDPKLNCHYEKDGIPLNALEMRELWKADRGAEMDVVYTPPRGRATADNKRVGGFGNWRRFGAAFRNNHLDTPFPGELAHGKIQYYADVYLWWEDQAVPVESPEYGNTSCRPSDYYWTLNYTTVDLQSTEEAGKLRVSLDTLTPNFEKFMVSIDGGEWREQAGSWVWGLHEGENTLRARSVNSFGIQCPATVARLRVEEAE